MALSEREELELLELEAAAAKAAPQRQPLTPEQMADFKARSMASMATADKGSFMKGVLGAGARADEMYQGVKSLFTKQTPEEKARLEAGRQIRKNSGAAQVGEAAMDIGSAVPLIAFGPEILAATGAAGVPAALAPYVSGAATGFGMGALTTPDNRLVSGAKAAAGNVAGEAGGRLLTRTLGGLVKPSAAGRQLLDNDIVPTVGQAADQNSLSGRLLRKGEEVAESVPLIGSIVRRARERPQKELMQQAFDRAIPPGGVSQAVSREGVDELGKQFKQAYGVLDNYIFKPDQRLEQDVLNIVTDPNYRASRETIDGVLNFFENNYTKKFQQGPQSVGAFLSGDGFKALDSEVGRRIRDLAGQQGQEALAERRIMTAIDNALSQYRNRQLPADVVADLSATDKAYAAWKRIARASKYSDSGEITPSQLTRSVKAMSQGDSYGRGNAFMQDLTDPASILKSGTPNSGTTDRAAAIALAGATLANPALFGKYAAGTAGAAGMYARPTQKFMLGAYPWQQKAGQFGNDYLIDALRLYGLQAGLGE